MKRLNSFVLFTLFSTGALLSGCDCLNPEDLEFIDNAINNLVIPNNHVTGMSLAVVYNGETVISKGYGKMDIENEIDAGNDTLFSIASISKSFAATIVVKTLSEKFPSYGESILDVPITVLAPNLNLTFSDRFRAEQTSFRDLLSHRTCLSDSQISLTFGNVKDTQEYTYRTRYQRQRQSCDHREEWDYSNSLYSLAGNLIADLQGTTFEKMVRDFMLEIGMQISTTVDSSASYEDLPNMSKGYFRMEGQIREFNMSLLRRIHIGLGAGGILSTSNDMAKYMSLHLNKGNVDGKQVVSEEAMSWLTKPSIPLREYPGTPFEGDSATGTYAYGLGFFLSLFKGYSMPNHSGFWPPYQSEMFLYPAKRLGVFMITNGPGILEDPAVGHAFVASLVFDIVSGVHKPQLTRQSVTQQQFPGFHVDKSFGNAKPMMSSFEQNYISRMLGNLPINFDEVIGVYGSAASGDLQVSTDSEDSRFLQINLGEWSIGRLLPVNDTKFLIDWKTDVMQHFYTFPPEMQEVPVFGIDFRVNSLFLLWNDSPHALFVKNATIDTFPVVPWDPYSCGPQ